MTVIYICFSEIVFQERVMDLFLGKTKDNVCILAQEAKSLSI